MKINTNQLVNNLSNNLKTKSTDKTDGFNSILSDTIAKQTGSTQAASENNSSSPATKNATSIVNSLTANAANDASSTTAIASNKTFKTDRLLIDPSVVAKETQETTETTATDQSVKFEINGNTLSFTVDMSKIKNVTINVKKNDDGTYSIDISEVEDPETPTELEEWMVKGHNYDNTAPAYSPVTGNPLNITVGEFIKMIDYASWNSSSKTHANAPTGQSWELFQSMLTSGLDPYVTMFY
jgi:hypothetical protein